MAAEIDSVSRAYRAMLPRWQKAEALLGGTEAMRAAGPEYLPRHRYESEEAYVARLQRTVLLNVYKKTATTLAGKPFSKPAKLGNEFPEQLGVIAGNVGGGVDLTSFAQRVFSDVLRKGFGAILVDFPKVAPGSIRSLADERAAGLRPYFARVAPESIIAAYSEVVDGEERFTHVRIREGETVRDGYGEKEVERIRVWEPGRWELWERGSDKKFHLVDQGANQLGEVPLVVFYAEREGMMLARSPLEDLADKNIEHWQASSDYRNALTTASFPILAGSGIEDDKGIVLGPKRILTISDPNAKLYYLEHSGAALAAGKADLDTLKDEMAMLGLALLVRRTGDVTATEAALNGAQAHSELQRMTLSCARALGRAFYFAARWMRLKVSPGAVVPEFNLDFGYDARQAADIDVLFKARQASEISRAAFLAELKRRGVLMEDFDAEADAERLAEEGPPLASFRMTAG